MLKTILFLSTLLFPVLVHAQATDSLGGNLSLEKAEEGSFLKTLDEKLDINFLLRSSLEVPEGASEQGGIKLNESRIELRGNLTPQLGYRFRYRLNRPFTPNMQDNAPSALDWAAATFGFGADQQWQLTIGKQSAAVGNWEFEKNPTFEYQYSEQVSRQLNLFLLAAKPSFNASRNHTLMLQLHNTHNNSFAAALNAAGYEANGLKPTKLPLGLYAAWSGNFASNQFRTFYSYNISQFAAGKLHHSIALGNKLVTNRLQTNLNLSWANIGVDYFNLASPAINNHNRLIFPNPEIGFAQDLNYKSAVMRVNYEFLPGWTVTAKGILETASHRKEAIWRKDFRKNGGLLAGLGYSR